MTSWGIIYWVWQSQHLWSDNIRPSHITVDTLASTLVRQGRHLRHRSTDASRLPLPYLCFTLNRPIIFILFFHFLLAHSKSDFEHVKYNTWHLSTKFQILCQIWIIFTHTNLAVKRLKRWKAIRNTRKDGQCRRVLYSRIYSCSCLHLLLVDSMSPVWSSKPKQQYPLTCKVSSCSYLPSRDCPANTKHLYNIYSMLDQRRRRWADVV